ncbi:MAG: hypothetical protein EOM15_15915, partial [Spirochaetia bacterium]|nr:hypothetical protein [Spirochaetia bacterium]
VTKGFVEGLAATSTELTAEMMTFDQLIVEWLQRGSDNALSEARRRLTTENAVSAYVQALEKARGELQVESKEYKRIVAEIDRVKPQQPSKKKDERSFAEQLSDIKSQYELFYQWIEYIGQEAAESQFAGLIKNGDSFLQYVNRQIAELERIKLAQGLTEGQSLELIHLRQQQAELTGQQTRLEAFRKEIAERKEGYNSISEYIVFLQGEIAKLNEIEAESAVAKVGVLGSELEKARQEQSNIFSRLMQDTASFEQRITAIRSHYADQRAALLEKKEGLSEEDIQRRLEAITRLEKAELDAENRIAMERSELYQELHKQVLFLGRRELEERIEVIRKIIQAEKEKAAALGLSTEHLEEFELALKSLELQLAQQSVESFRQIAGMLRTLAGLAGQFDKELEQAHTYDEYWNSAPQEMVITGKMHGYMRMYWGKK